MYRSRQPVTVRLRVVSVKGITTWDEKGTPYQVLRLGPEPAADAAAPDEFSVYISPLVKAALQRIGIKDVSRHFADHVIEVHGPVFAIGRETGSPPKTHWTYHIELKSLDQVRRVESAERSVGK